MNPTDVFRRIICALESAQISYMLTGSFASSYYGTQRTTHDIDLVIAATADQLRALVSLLPQTEYYVDLGAALEAHRNQSLFNVIDFSSGWKIDLIMRKSDRFAIQAFNRRDAIDLYGIRLFISTAEDVVISKLQWARLSESQRQIRDIAGILEIRGDALDREYLNKWIAELGLTAEWRAALEAAGMTGADDRT